MKKKKIYEAPTMSIVWQNIRIQLLAGSGEYENDGYGSPIKEGDSGGWTNA